MFGTRNTEEEAPKEEEADLEVPKNAGMPGFVEDEPEPAKEKPKSKPKPKAAAKPKPVEPEPAVVEQYQIVETAISPTAGLYVYKIITNKYLGELGGVYEA